MIVCVIVPGQCRAHSTPFNLALGVNWYLNEKLRLMANAIKALDVDRPGSVYGGLNPLIFALRAQWLVY